MSDAFVSFTARFPALGVGSPHLAYSEELAARLCERVAEGETVPAICLSLGLNRGTLHRWLTAHEDFREAYAVAKMLRGDALIDQMQDVCADELKGKHALGVKVSAVLANMQWRASVLNRGAYGDKAEVALTGGLALAINTKWRGNAPAIEGEAERLDPPAMQIAGVRIG